MDGWMDELNPTSILLHLLIFPSHFHLSHRFLFRLCFTKLKLLLIAIEARRCTRGGPSETKSGRIADTDGRALGGKGVENPLGPGENVTSESFILINPQNDVKIEKNIRGFFFAESSDQVKRWRGGGVGGCWEVLGSVGGC